MRIYQRDWGVETAGWSIDYADGVLTLCPADVDAALQISCFRKRAGGISREELGEFAREQLPAAVRPVDVTRGDFMGCYGDFVSEGVFWRCWWLARANVHLCVTYSTAPEHGENPSAVVDWMLSSLVAEGRA